MRRLSRHLLLLKQDQKGGVLILVAASLIMLLGMTALVVDIGQLYVVRRQMVSAADGAALAGAVTGENNPNKPKTRAIAKHYAEENGAEGFNEEKDVYFYGEGDDETISVRVKKEVDYTFARVLGLGNSTNVGAIASAKKGPGNPLVPFVDKAWECDECEGTGEVCDEVEECEECDKCEGRGFYVINSDGDPAEFGDEYQLKYDRWEEWGYVAGNYPYIRLGDQKGGADLEYAIAAGYTGALSEVAIGTEHRDEPGHTQGKLVQGLETRMEMHGEPLCTDVHNLCSGTDYYGCVLVVILPIVELVSEDNNNRYFEIVGYVSVLLILEETEDDDDKEVWAQFIEYVTYEKLLSLAGPNPEGFIVRLVKDPVAAINFFNNN